MGKTIRSFQDHALSVPRRARFARYRLAHADGQHNPRNLEESCSDLRPTQVGRFHSEKTGLQYPPNSGRARNPHQARRDRLADGLGVTSNIVAKAKQSISLHLISQPMMPPDTAAPGSAANREPDGAWTFPYQLARAQCLLAASAAGTAPIDTVDADFRDHKGLEADFRRLRRDGFLGRMAIRPDQAVVTPAIRQARPRSPRRGASSTPSKPRPTPARSASTARWSTSHT